MGPGDVIASRFVIERAAGAGDAGAVYRAEDRTTGEIVALKIVRPEAPGDAARFIREAITLSELKHPAVVRYVAHGVTPHDELYLAMEWLEGEDLQERLLSTGLTIAESVRAITRVAQALALVHARGVVHRDIKPSNLFLKDGDLQQIKILDFGIARFGHSRRLTVGGELLGTPGYMAPEQARQGGVVTAAADVFALGCVLFECLTGRAAFAAEARLPLLAKILLEDAPPISELCVGVPDALEDLVARMLSKDPGRRPRDGAAVASELARLDVPDRPSLPPLSRGVMSGPGSGSRLVSVALVAPRELAAGSATISQQSPAIDPGAAEGLREAVEGRGGKLRLLADGSMAAMLAGGGDAGEHAAQAARCALAMRAAAPDRPMALATARGPAAARYPVGDAIDKAGRLLVRAADAAGATRGIALDEATAGLLDAQFTTKTSGTGLFSFLFGERAGAGQKSED